jgi:hypothetical protein
MGEKATFTQSLPKVNHIGRPERHHEKHRIETRKRREMKRSQRRKSQKYNRF